MNGIRTEAPFDSPASQAYRNANLVVSSSSYKFWRMPAYDTPFCGIKKHQPHGHFPPTFVEALNMGT